MFLLIGEAREFINIFSAQSPQYKERLFIAWIESQALSSREFCNAKQVEVTCHPNHSDYSREYVYNLCQEYISSKRPLPGVKGERQLFAQCSESRGAS